LQQFLLCRTDPAIARPSVRGLPRGLSPTPSAVLEAGGKLERGGIERAYSAQTDNIQYQFYHPYINFIIHISILSSNFYFIPFGFHS
jgi:hypothetical protein